MSTRTIRPPVLSADQKIAALEERVANLEHLLRIFQAGSDITARDVNSIDPAYQLHIRGFGPLPERQVKQDQRRRG